MKVKKYIADTMPEAMNEIRKDLGTEAVILQSKRIKKKGFFGLFQQNKIEVIAAKDPEPIAEVKIKTPPDIVEKPKAQHVQANFSETAILGEIRNLKKLMELQVTNEMSLPAVYQVALQHLLHQEVEQSLAEKLIQETAEKVEAGNTDPSQAEVNETLKKVITAKLDDLTFEGITAEQKIVQFVGPTGVGKTTTIAKVAAQLILQEKKTVAFITTDTYRIAAIEQLKTYARILNVPLEVAYNVADYKQAAVKLAAYDVILVDTAGRNYRNPLYIKQLQEMMGTIDNIATYLVMALTAKPQDLTVLFEQFRHIPLNEVIFTKVDETAQYGSILSITLANEIGVAYMTNGQDVPDDLLKPTPEMISEWIVGEENG